MAGIDDELKNDRYAAVAETTENSRADVDIKNNTKTTERERPDSGRQKPNVSVKLIEQKEKSWMNVFWSVVCYCVDVSFIVLSFIMIKDFYGSYPLIFSVALIIWLAFRILSFKRNSNMDFVMGLVLLLMAIVLYYFVFEEFYRRRDEIVGRIIIPTVYLGFFCVWDVLRRKSQEENREK